MDALIQSWSQLFVEVQSARLAIVTIVAVAAFVFVCGVLYVIAWTMDPARRRLVKLESVSQGPARGSLTVRLAAYVQPFARYVMPSSSKERGAMQDRFLKAGLDSPTALPVFYGVKTLLALALLGAWLFCADFLPQLSSHQVIFYATLAAFLGLTLPNFVLNRLIDRRQRALRNAFPDALDLLIVCVESGLGLAAGLQRVALELEVSHPELAGELVRVNAEMQAGMEREVALKNLATRTGLEDIRGLVSLLVQTLRFGTSVADALRVYAEEFRDKRAQLAEELAAKLGTKMIFPLVFCFFPSFFLVAIGPAVIRIIEVFSGQG